MDSVGSVKRDCPRRKVENIGYNAYPPWWEAFDHRAYRIHTYYEVGIYTPDGMNDSTMLYLMRGPSESGLILIMPIYEEYLTPLYVQNGNWDLSPRRIRSDAGCL